MSYPYINPKADFAHRKKNFSELSAPASSTGKVFQPDFSAQMPTMYGIDLDNVAKKDFSHYSEKVLASCDSLQEGTDGKFYLVEFKNQNSGNINRDEIHKKIIDSLSLILFAFSPGDSIRTLHGRVKVFVVFPDQNAFLKIVKTIGESGGLAGQENKKLSRPLWNLQKLVDDEFIGFVDTMTLSEFKLEVSNWPTMVLP